MENCTLAGLGVFGVRLGIGPRGEPRLQRRLGSRRREPARLELISGASGAVLGRTRSAEQLIVPSGAPLKDLMRLRLTDEAGNPCSAPDDLAVELRVESGTPEEGPWFEVGGERLRQPAEQAVVRDHPALVARL